MALLFREEFSMVSGWCIKGIECRRCREARCGVFLDLDPDLVLVLSVRSWIVLVWCVCVCVSLIISYGPSPDWL
jgi:hypothetical protein